jgi:hypothetical protein
MITINFSPVRSDAPELVVEWNDPILTVNDTPFDMSLLEDGDTAEHEVLKQASRTGDDYTVTVSLPHGPNAPEETRLPAPILVTSNGVVPVPVYNSPEPTEEI